ncbi:MAG: MaoC family dehydratase N-terminal domain-containing protein, partial [Phenylobacterium sp.]|nr:MaoC family dehydratase N-terminal domain-containing protein [Phenylobacterium sp.]
MATKTFPVEAGHILMFARSVGDGNRVYSDAEYAKTTEAGGIIAPPTFAQASAQFDPDYGLRPKIGQPWFGSGKNATGITRAPG